MSALDVTEAAAIDIATYAKTKYPGLIVLIVAADYPESAVVFANTSAADAKDQVEISIDDLKQLSEVEHVAALTLAKHAQSVDAMIHDATCTKCDKHTQKG